MATSRRTLRGVGYEPEARAGLNPEPGTLNLGFLFPKQTFRKNDQDYDN